MDKSENYIIAVGGSAGSLQNIIEFVGSFPKDIGATFFVVLHRPADKKSNLENILNINTDLHVNLVDTGEHLECATIYINKPAEGLKMNDVDEVESYFNFDREIKSINELFMSLAQNVKEKAIGIVLSGALDDGSDGLKAIKEHGGITIVQNPEEASFDSMPISAIRSTHIDLIGTIEEITKYLNDLLRGTVCED